MYVIPSMQLGMSRPDVWEVDLSKGGAERRRRRRKREVEDEKEAKSSGGGGNTEECYGAAGGSVWKNYAVKEGLRVAALTGVVSKHAERCNMFRREADTVQVSFHTRMYHKDTLEWILDKIKPGKCSK